MLELASARKASDQTLLHNIDEARLCIGRGP